MFRIGSSLYQAGVVHAAAYASASSKGPDTILPLIHELSIDAIEGSWAEGDEAARSILSWSGCDIVYVAGGLMRSRSIDPSATDPDARSAMLAAMRKIVDAANWYDARLLLISAGPDVAVHERAGAIAALGATLRELCRYAEQTRPQDPLWVTFENFDRELDQKRLLGPTVETAALIADIRRDHGNIGMTLDMSHVAQLGEDFAQAVATAGELVVHAHVANCGLDAAMPRAFGDSHCRFGMPGGRLGADDVVTFLGALDAAGYGRRTVPTKAPLISVEMKTADGETPELVLVNGLRMLLQSAARTDILTTRNLA
ncbi:MAG: sugar phosphate isomerase/epimerase [Hyphomicrobiales bacterium]|nr:MAG: sugar phosphate isomerase/epimerase [Hyphomicrobiales bacterium]